jgi:hypothetical protein
MKTNYSAFHFTGSQTNMDDKSSAINCFEKNHGVKFVQDNKTGEVLARREHVRCGTIRSGIKFMGNIPVYQCSDTGVKITSTGELLSVALERIGEIEKDRVFNASYQEYPSPGFSMVTTKK